MKVAVCFRAWAGDTSAAAATAGGGETAAQIVRRMALAQQPAPPPSAEEPMVEVREVCGGRGALCAVPSAERHSRLALRREAAGGGVLLVSGVPVAPGSSVERRLERALAAAGGEDEERAAGAVGAELARLDGAHASVYWEAGRGRLVVVTDFLGMQPLYIYEGNGLMALSSDLKGLSGAGVVEVEMDPAGWGGFVSFGHAIGPVTALRGVTRFPPGSISIYDPATGKWDHRKYWKWPPQQNIQDLTHLNTKIIADALTRDVEAFLEHHGDGTLLLSGGFDSRLLLAILRRLGQRPRTLIVRELHKHFDADGRFAEQVARRLGVEYEVVTPERGYYSTAEYERYLWMNEVATPSLNLFIAQVSAYIRPAMQAVWEGVFPGCILVPLQKTEGGFDQYLKQTCQLGGSPNWRAAERVFAPAVVAAMDEAFRHCLADERARYVDNDFGVTEFVVRNRTRNRTAPNPLKVYANRVLAFTPGLSKDFWHLAASLPFDIKAKHRLYLEILNRHFPEASSIPYCTGGYVKKGSGLNLSYYTTILRSGLSEKRIVAGALRRTGLKFSWPASALVNRALAAVNVDHPDLNAAEVKKLKGLNEVVDETSDAARTLLFYWQQWRNIMSRRAE